MFELFLNPWLLGGTALAAAPIIIHLLNKRRFQIHDWAAMDFLLQAVVSNRRRIKFQDLLLLLLRVAVLLLLVFTVARPVLRGLGGWSEDERIVVLDDSFSMEVFTPTGAVFESARQSAMSQTQDAIGGSIPVSLRLATRPDVAALEVGRPLGEDGDDEEGGTGATQPSVLALGSELLDALREIEAVDVPARIGKTLELVFEAAEADKTPLKRSVVLVSDFRATDWLSGKGELAEPIAAAFEALREKEREASFGFRLVDVGREDIDNVAVTGFRAQAAHTLTGVPVKLAVEVTNFSDKPRARLEGELEIGAPAASAFHALHRVPLPPFENVEPHATAMVEVEHIFDKPGQYLLRASIEKDQLPRDDDASLVVNVRESLRVTLVDGAPGRGRFAGESGFLMAALSPRGTLRTGLEPKVVTGAIEAATLADTDVLFVLNRESLAAYEWKAIAERAREGMGVGFFLGDKVDPASYAASGEAAASRQALFPLELGAPTSPPERVPMRFGDFEHAAFEVFRGVEGASLEAVAFSRYLKVQLREGARVVARFADTDGDDGTPAIVETSLGPGRVVIFNTSADRDWSDWPTDPSYLITLQEWARWLAPRFDEQNNFVCGEPLAWKVTPGHAYEVVTPRGERRAIDPAGGERPAVEAAFEDTSVAGFYRLVERHRTAAELEDALQGSSARPGAVDGVPTDGAQPSSGAGGARDDDRMGNRDDDTKATWFAFRRPQRESDLRPTGAPALRELLTAQKVRFSIGQELEVDALERDDEGEMWRFLAYAAALFLLSELALAWWFGRQ